MADQTVADKLGAGADAAETARILVVDDVPTNVRMLAGMLKARGYEVVTAGGGKEGLEKLRSEKPDLVLLDVMMPDMNGYDVCREIRADAATAMLPVVMVTALDPDTERVKGIEAGADDFLCKPINLQELLARVRSLLRVKNYHETIEKQAAQLREWGTKLEERIAEQVGQLDRLGRLKGFFSAALAEAIVSGGADEVLKPHRREVTVVFLDVRGFTNFTEGTEPEELMEFLRDFHHMVGTTVTEHCGTIERFAGDGMMIFFNDPIVLENPAASAVRMALAARDRFAPIEDEWRKRGYSLRLGCGIALGYATLGMIGFEGRRDYAAIGSVTNLAARLCGEAKGGQVLISQKTHARIESFFEVEPAGELTLKGFSTAINAFNVLRAK